MSEYDTHWRIATFCFNLYIYIFRLNLSHSCLSHSLSLCMFVVSCLMYVHWIAITAAYSIHCIKFLVCIRFYLNGIEIVSNMHFTLNMPKCCTHVRYFYLRCPCKTFNNAWDWDWERKEKKKKINNNDIKCIKDKRHDNHYFINNL